LPSQGSVVNSPANLGKLVETLRKWVETLTDDEREIEIAILGVPGFSFKRKELPDVVAKWDDRSKLVLTALLTWLHLHLDVRTLETEGFNEPLIESLIVVVEGEIARRTGRR